MREERQLFYALLILMFTLSVVSLPLRLLGGKHHYEGRIEVLYDGKWGEVCDHKWNLAGARVACRMLGFPDAERYTFGDWWGKGSGYFWLDDVQCEGTEKSLLKCKRKDWGRCNCRRGENAGVICREADEKRVIYPSPSNFSQGIVDLPVRLYGPLRRGYISQGVLQVQVGGRWGAVCSHGWTEFNSRVACGMLGYVDANKVDIKVKTVNSTTYLMSNVKCSGRESSLVECEHQGWGRLECEGGSHVTVSCKRSNMLKHPSLRLRGSHRLWEGRVEVKSKNRHERLHWGTVCDDEFDLLDANVACRTLGLGTASRVFTNAKFGQGSRSIYMDNVQCNGWEKAFSECSYKDKTDCTHYEDVSVRCNAPKPHLRKIRLVGGRNAMEGFVEMHDGTKWGAVCGEGWGIEEASVTCRQLDLGFGMRAVKGKYNFGLSSVKIQYSHLDCSLSEISLFHCSRALPHKTRCKSLLRAGVICTKVLPDLVVNVEELERHVRIDAIPLRYLRCSYEENCLGSSARRQWNHNQHYVRRLLRFTTRIENRGLASFVPDVPRAQWQWHECHQHYHSMEVFSVYDLINTDGMKIAAGHKASFCLEDTVCDSGIHRYFNCTDGGPQGVSPNCYDVYKWNIDCQWIDVTDHPYGTFYLRVVVNPHRRVPESDYLNNIAKCKLSDYGHFAYASDCRLENCESGVDTHGGNSNGACCVFPFRYRGRLYRSCITTDLNRNWCATTRNFDRDKLYGICF